MDLGSAVRVISDVATRQERARLAAEVARTKARLLTTNDLTHALAFARSDVHAGDPAVILSQAKAACRTLADEVERLQEIEQLSIDLWQTHDAATELGCHTITQVPKPLREIMDAATSRFCSYMLHYATEEAEQP